MVILGISLFNSALTDYSISTAYESGQKAAFLADFCLKEGVIKLQEDISYIGGEEINVNNATCSYSINFVKQIGAETEDVKTKEISSLGRAGDQPHFNRASQRIRYIIEPGDSGWIIEGEGADLENVGVVGDSLTLQSAETKTFLNEASGISCDMKCQQEGQQEGTTYSCISIGTNDPDYNDGQVQTCLEE